MVDCICKELILRKHYLNNQIIETIYFGGGTPSLLNEFHLNQIFETINKHFIVDTKEVTLEANPEDLLESKLKMYQNLGIERLSIGVQTFNDELLKKINRSHNSKTAFNAILSAHDAGISNISIDLIYGLIGSTKRTWDHDLNLSMKLPIKHISSYNLTIEEKTVFGNLIKKNELPDVNEDLSVWQYNRMKECLENNNFEQYEISNFSKKGSEALHNTNYWRGINYLGIGPSAHSFDTKSRSFNVRNNSLYMKSIGNNEVPLETEVLTRKSMVNDYILTSLRTKWGCDLKYLNTTFEYNLVENEHERFQYFSDNEWIIQQNDVIVLTDSGKLFADMIASHFFID